MKLENKKVLFFFAENPFSRRGGNILRAYTNLKILNSLGLSIDLVGYEDSYKHFGDSTDLIDPKIIDDYIILNRRPKKNKFSKEYWEFKIKDRKKREGVHFFITDYVKKTFQEFFNKKKYDYVLINYEYWTDLLRGLDLSGTKTIVDTHDWITLNEFYKNKNLNIGEKFNEELKNLDFYDRVISISQDEHFVFKSFLGDKVINIPPSFPFQGDSKNVEKKYDLIFVGSDNPFNIKSINWFVEKVLSLLPQETKVCIIGRVSNHVPEHNNIEKHNFISNLEDYYHQSKIAICPMLDGTGIKIKVIEAMSFGLPIVGTEKAVDGFPQKTSNGCLVSDDEKVFAEYINLLLNNKEEYEKQQKQAVDFFKENFSEENALEKWRNALK